VSRLETLGIEIPVSEATLVRMPCAPEKLGSRDLPDAVWGDLDVISHACLCILHAAMRTGENWFTRSLSVSTREAHTLAVGRGQSRAASGEG
jgi:hypothetical protein